MNPDNKKRLVEGLKILGLAVWFLLTAATCGGVWSFCPEKAVCVFASFLFAWNIGLIVYCAIKVFKQNDSYIVKDDSK